MAAKQRVLVTGANGFVGAALMRLLSSEGKYAPIGAVRDRTACCGVRARCLAVGDVSRDTAWQEALDGVDVVVHTAARTHVMSESADDPLEAYRRVNVDGARALAEQAAEAGVRRLIFLSSIKVNGEETATGSPFCADHVVAPEDPYGQSKWEAEQALMEVGAGTGLEVVIIRPPLVYGPGVKGNFARMMTWVAKGVPLPLGAIDNRRSLVAVNNLVDLVAVCIDHPAARNQMFLAGDGEDLSTTELILRLGKAMGRPARLLTIPPGLLRLGAAMLGKGDMARRLLGSLEVDISKARDVLGWEPPVSVDEGLRWAVEPHVSRRSGFSGDERSTDDR